MENQNSFEEEDILEAWRKSKQSVISKIGRNRRMSDKLYLGKHPYHKKLMDMIHKEQLLYDSSWGFGSSGILHIRFNEFEKIFHIVVAPHSSDKYEGTYQEVDCYGEAVPGLGYYIINRSDPVLYGACSKLYGYIKRYILKDCPFPGCMNCDQVYLPDHINDPSLHCTECRNPTRYCDVCRSHTYCWIYARDKIHKLTRENYSYFSPTKHRLPKELCSQCGLAATIGDLCEECIEKDYLEFEEALKA